MDQHIVKIVKGPDSDSHPFSFVLESDGTTVEDYVADEKSDGYFVSAYDNRQIITTNPDA